MRILSIEDDSATAQSIELMLKSEGMSVYITDMGEEGLNLAKMYDYDLILLDLSLPDMSGIDILRRLRTSKIGTPVLVLTGCADMDTKVKCLAIGADDYMTKPFHKDELVGRIHAIVRRSKGHCESVILTGEISVNMTAKTVEVAGKKLHLTNREYDLLELLSMRKNATLTKDAILNHMYGGIDEPEVKIVDVFLCKVRRKLGDSAVHIETVWGRGYRMVDTPSSLGMSFQARMPLTLKCRILYEIHKADTPLSVNELLDLTGSPRGSIYSATGFAVEAGELRALGNSNISRTYQVTEAGIAAYKDEEKTRGITNEAAKLKRSHPEGEGSSHLAASA